MHLPTLIAAALAGIAACALAPRASAHEAITLDYLGDIDDLDARASWIAADLPGLSEHGCAVQLTGPTAFAHGRDASVRLTRGNGASPNRSMHIAAVAHLADNEPSFFGPSNNEILRTPTVEAREAAFEWTAPQSVAAPSPGALSLLATGGALVVTATPGR